MLAYTLINSAVVCGNIVIQGHESDRVGRDDVNISGYPYEENGFVVRSISDDYFGLFLSYKIEAFSDPTDARFSFNSIRPAHEDILNYSLTIDEQKLTKYLVIEKKGILETLGLISYTTEQLEALIKCKMLGNYIYNLSYLEEHDVPKFNISLDLDTIYGDKRKTVVSIKADTNIKELKLITMY